MSAPIDDPLSAKTRLAVVAVIDPGVGMAGLARAARRSPPLATRHAPFV